MPLRGRLRGCVWRNSGREYRDTGIEGKAIQGRYTAATESRSSCRGGRFRGLFGKIYRAGGRPFPCCREQIGRERELVEVYRGPGDMGPGPGRG